MNWPADPVMLMCVAHAAGDKFVARDGELHITVQSEERTIPAPTGALDDLESRGWVELRPGGETVLSEKGAYWTRRWLEKRFGKGRLKQIGQFRTTGGAA